MNDETRKLITEQQKRIKSLVDVVLSENESEVRKALDLKDREKTHIFDVYSAGVKRMAVAIIEEIEKQKL